MFRTPSLKHPEWLDVVRAYECVCCGVWGQQHAHHAIGQRFSSAKVSDVLTMPLCAPCHTKLHEGWQDWEAQHGSQWMHAAKTFEQGVRDGVWVLDRKLARALSNGRGNP